MASLQCLSIVGVATPISQKGGWVRGRGYRGGLTHQFVCKRAIMAVLSLLFLFIAIMLDGALVADGECVIMG